MTVLADRADEFIETVPPAVDNRQHSRSRDCRLSRYSALRYIVRKALSTLVATGLVLGRILAHGGEPPELPNVSSYAPAADVGARLIILSAPHAAARHPE